MINVDTVICKNKMRFLSGFAPSSTAHRIIPSGNINGAVLATRCIKGAVPILHGSIGCSLHYRYFARLNNVVLDELICTELTEDDYIMGGEAKLRKVIISVYKECSPKMIVVIPTDPILVVNADIEAVLGDLSDELNCEMLYARIKTVSQPFSRWHIHSDLSLSDEEAQAEEDRIKSDYELEAASFGCGFADVYMQLVETLIKPLPRDEKLLVVGGMPLARSPDSLIDGLLELLGEFGLKVLFLNTPVEPGVFAGAAAAVYSVGFPRGSAYTLKRLFGVEVLPDELWEHLSDGLDGIEKFYLGIADIFNLGDQAAAKIIARKQMVYRRLREAGAIMDKNSCAFCVDYPGVIPWVTTMLRGAIGINIKYILLTTEDRTYYNPELSEEDIKTIIRRSMKKCTDELGYQPTLLIDPDPEEIYKVADEVDYFIGGNHFPAVYEKNRGVTDIPNRRPDSFDGYEEYYISYARSVRENDANPRGRLLKDKLLHLESENTKASHAMRFRTT